MAEVGVVKEVKGSQLIISLNRQEACNKCRGCIQGMQEKEMIMEAENLCSATVGDHVEVMLESTNFLKAVLILYGIPFLALISGVLIGYFGTIYYLNQSISEIIALVLGFILLAVSYLIIRLNENKFKTKSYKPVAIKKVDPLNSH